MNMPTIDLAPILARCTRTEDGCLLWPGSTHAGYGVVKRRGKRYRLHRLVLEAALGRSLPRDVHARHRCPGGGRRNCLVHVEPGSAADNVADMVAAGRQARGETHGLHRLTIHAVREARAARASGVKYTEMAAEFGVAASTMRRAVVGSTWGWLP